MLILPSADVVEISQNFYWPLHTKPIDWIYQELVSEMSEARRSDLVSRVEHELSLLQFKRDTVSDRINLSRDLLEEKDDWFNELSGGQKCKVELVRKVRRNPDKEMLHIFLPVPIHKCKSTVCCCTRAGISIEILSGSFANR